MSQEGPIRPRPLTQEQAVEEERMIKAQLGVNLHSNHMSQSEFEKKYPEFPQFGDGHREPTPEEYDQALQAILDLEELAAEEQTSDKIKDVFGRLAANSAIAGWAFVFALSGGGVTNVSEDIFDHKLKPAVDWKEKFKGAAYRLSELKKKAAQYQS